MRVILDTNVIVAAFRSRTGASNALLELAIDGRFQALASVALFLEYTDAVSRPEFKRDTGFNDDDIENLIGALANLYRPVDVWFHTRPVLRDPKDELALETAVNGQAASIATFNVRDFENVTRLYGIDVSRPRDLLRRLTG